jgi:hypothetical protein
MPIIGDYYSQTFTYFQLSFERCINSSANPVKCASLQEIDLWMAKNKISLAFKNNYFDFKNFTSEISTFIDDSVFVELQSGTRKMVNIYF